MKMDTLRRSRNPTTVMTANGKVQTNEEAQVYVHDLDLFVTVQWLENTSAVLSLGKFCSEHGYSYEQKNGQNRQLTPNGNAITCTMDNFVHLVVPGLSSSSNNSTSSSTSMPADQSKFSEGPETSPDPVTTRCDKPACGKLMQTDPDKPATGNRESAHKKKNEMDKEDPMQEILEWLQTFTDNLEDLETHVPEHSSKRDTTQIRKVLQKWWHKKLKDSIYTHFPKDRNCDVCLRTKITRIPCRRRHEGHIPRAEKFGDLITADHKVLNEGIESRNNHRYAVVVQDLVTQWIHNLIRVKPKLHRRQRRVYESFQSRHRSQKLFIHTIHWNFGKSCEELAWNHRTSIPQLQNEQNDK